MSRSNPTPTNPATRFFEWSGSKGQLEFYDKEQQKRIPVPLPFEFLVLDELATIVGYSKRDESGFWSNEVRNITKDELTVKTKKGTAQVGLYKDLAEVRAKGAKYCKSVYMAYKTREGWQIGNFKASGSALGSWIEYGQQYKPENGKTVITRGEQQESPVGAFYAPELAYEHSSAEEDGEAIRLDKSLQVYLAQYLTAKPELDEPVIEDEVDINTLGTATDEEVAEHDKEKAHKEGVKEAVRKWDEVGQGKTVVDREDAAAIETYKDIVTTEFDESEPINLSDIPF